MATGNEKLGTEDHAKLQEMLAEFYDAIGHKDRTWAAGVAYDIVGQEVIEMLLAENAAMREIVQAVADKGGEYWEAGDNVCLYCGARILAGVTGLEDDAVRHRPDCPVTKARALLAVEASNGK